jgi:hypothetical protein
MRPDEMDVELSTIVLGPTRSPGVVTLSGHDRKKNWDVKKAKGSTGASTTLNGDDPAEFKASFYLADDGSLGPGELTDFDQWESFQRLIEATTSLPIPFALPVYHPDLARNHITEVTNGGISGMVHDGKGGATVVVTFREYKPQKKKKAASPTAKPGGAVAGAPSKPDPNAAAKAELAALLAQAKKT